MKHQTEELGNQEAYDTTGGTSIRYNPPTTTPYGHDGLSGDGNTNMQPTEMPAQPHGYGSDQADSYQTTASYQLDINTSVIARKASPGFGGVA